MMKSSLFQHFCLVLDGMIPKQITKLIYYPSFLVFSILCRVHFSSALHRVYLRNSFYLDYYTFGLSDYDFGIVFDRRVPKQSWNSFYQQFQLIKKVFPFWGEINVYSLDEMKHLLPFINPIEARRDPFLNSYSLRKPASEDKFSFISRCLFVNLKNWNFESRKKKKWQTYFQLCEIEIDQKNDIQFVLNNVMASFYQTEIQKSYPQFIKKFHTLFLNSKDILWEPSTEEVKVLMPQYYLWFEREEGAEQFLNDLSLSDKKVLISQLKWEVWGLTTQMFHFQSNESFTIHLLRIKKVFETVDLPKEEIESLNVILRIFDRMNQI